MNLVIISLSLFLHLLAMVVWIGGIVMILSVILPVANATLESPMKSRLMKGITERFTPLVNISILVLIVTGIVIAHHEKNFTSFLDFNNPWNAIIFLKHFFVALMVIIHFYRGLVLNPKIGRLSSQVVNLQRFSLNLIKTNLVLGLIVLLLTSISPSL